MRAVRRVLLVALLLALVATAGCGGGSDAPAQTVPRAQAALARVPKQPGEIVVQGEASPASHGPFELHGTYVARFEQYAPEDPHMDFASQTPFVARLDPHADRDDAPAAVKLFARAARTGTATVRADGSLYVDVEFGDFPYAIRLTPKR